MQSSALTVQARKQKKSSTVPLIVFMNSGIDELVRKDISFYTGIAKELQNLHLTHSGQLDFLNKALIVFRNSEEVGSLITLQMIMNRYFELIQQAANLASLIAKKLKEEPNKVPTNEIMGLLALRAQADKVYTAGKALSESPKLRELHSEFVQRENEVTYAETKEEVFSLLDKLGLESDDDKRTEKRLTIQTAGTAEGRVEDDRTEKTETATMTLGALAAMRPKW